MDWKTIILIITLFPNIILAILSYYRGRKNKSSHLWTTLIWTLIFWITAMIFYRIAEPQNVLISCRVLYILASLIPIPFLFFSFLFPEERWPYKKWSMILLLLPTLIIIFLVIYPGAIIEDVEILPGQENKIVWGPLYLLYALYFSAYFSWALWNILKKYINAQGLIKNQLRYIFFGTGISSVLGVIFNLFLPWIGNFDLNWLGQVTTLFMVGAVTYAISRYKLMDIRVILTEFLVSLIALLLLMEVIISETVYGKIYKGAIFLIFCFFGYLLIKNVVNEIKRREELEILTLELEKLDKAKSEFLSIASHQLRTPLTAIRGYSSMVLENSYGKILQKTRGPIKNILISSERLLKLVNDLLNLSRIESGRLEIKFSKVPLEELILGIISELELKAKEKGIYIKLENNFKPLLKLTLDQDKIRQAILNLIDNAIKYTDKGGITVELKDENDRLKIMVSDTGAGIEKEEIGRLFESFSRGSAGNRFWTNGTGLGLYVAKKFVEMHDGRIWAESEGKGKGSTFYIELPIK